MQIKSNNDNSVGRFSTLSFSQLQLQRLLVEKFLSISSFGGRYENSTSTSDVKRFGGSRREAAFRISLDFDRRFQFWTV